MSWLPGVGPVKDISAVGISRGLSEDWYTQKGPHKRNRKEIKKGNFWDIIDNPLYQVAAEAAGFDWAEWIADAKGKVGTGPDDGIRRVRAVVRPAERGRTNNMSGGPNAGIQYVTTPGRPAEYEIMTADEADERGLDYTEIKTTRWKNKDTGEIITGHPLHRGRTSDAGPYQGMTSAQAAIGANLPEFRTPIGAGGIASIIARRRDDDWEDDWEELHDWGIHSEEISEDLDGMQRWLLDIVQINDHLPKIIREGPKGEHYGIEGDIWEHYGLDEEIEPPKEMEWDSYDKKMELATAVTSTVGYSTPEGITPVDLHGD